MTGRRLIPLGVGWPGWVRPDAPERFAALAVEAAATAGPPPVTWVTWRHANGTALRACLVDRPSPGRHRLDVAALIRTLDHLVAGHVLAAAAVRSVRPEDEVTCEVRALPVYEVGALLEDLLRAPSAGVERWQLGAWLAERRAAFNLAVPPPAGPLGRALRAWATAAIAAERALPRAVAAVYPSG